MSFRSRQVSRLWLLIYLRIILLYWSTQSWLQQKDGLGQALLHQEDLALFDFFLGKSKFLDYRPLSFQYQHFRISKILNKSFDIISWLWDILSLLFPRFQCKADVFVLHNIESVLHDLSVGLNVDQVCCSRLELDAYWFACLFDLRVWEMMIKSGYELFNRGWLLNKATFFYFVLEKAIRAFQIFDYLVIELDILIERGPALDLQISCTVVQDWFAIDNSESADNCL